MKFTLKQIVAASLMGAIAYGACSTVAITGFLRSIINQKYASAVLYLAFIIFANCTFFRIVRKVLLIADATEATVEMKEKG